MFTETTTAQKRLNSRIALEVLALLAAAAACIALAMATFTWLARIDAVTYVPSDSLTAPLSAIERMP